MLKSFSFRGLCPLTPTGGVAPGPPLGALPPGPPLGAFCGPQAPTFQLTFPFLIPIPDILKLFNRGFLWVLQFPFGLSSVNDFSYDQLKINAISTLSTWILELSLHIVWPSHVIRDSHMAPLLHKCCREHVCLALRQKGTGQISILTGQLLILKDQLLSLTGQLLILKDQLLSLTGQLLILKDQQSILTGQLLILKDQQLSLTGQLLILTGKKLISGEIFFTLLAYVWTSSSSSAFPS